ncbi:hypothetical protein DFH08DRAFT_836350 [Mycena albidolilacea]|uniref:GSKIP domain-containing protein n=1 Tax=Mycena albidolilacea TaxID=1033008 RepID=A0AAD7ASL6_9AGAR|nr:hypothetical protein DFH08DRAFT_836350 [Mycena albidolilacea]
MTSFCADELQHALAEESSASAIGPFRLTFSDSLRATASVTLLEGRTISINLTTSGYSIIQKDTNGQTVPSLPGRTFESIEQLLRSVSTMYGKRREEALIAALERVFCVQTN